MPSLLKYVGTTMDMNDVKSVFNLSTNMSYITFSKGTSPELVARWQKALDDMKTDGTFRQIYAKWLPTEKSAGNHPDDNRGISACDLHE